MAEVTSKIQDIEGHLVAMGMLPEAQANGEADAAFLRGLDQTARFLGAVLKIENIDGYSEKFGQQLLQKLGEMDAEALEQIKTLLKDNSDLDLSPNWAAGPMARAIQNRLSDAGIPREQWGDVKLGGLLPLIENATQIVADIQEVTADEKVVETRQEVEKIAKSEIQTAQEIVLKALGKEGQEWGAAATQDALKDYVVQLQKDLGAPERYGAFSKTFSDYLTQKITEGELPEGYEADDLKSFASSMDVLRTNSVYVEPEEPLDVAKATQVLRSFLKETVPQVNKALETQSEQWGALAEFMVGNLLNQRIAEIEVVDGPLNLQDQASLQGLLMVLGHDYIFGFPGDKDWLWTPEIEAWITEKLENPDERLQGILKQAGLENLKSEDLQAFFDAMNVLREAEMLSQEALIDKNLNSIEIPLYVRGLYQDQIDKYHDSNSDMLHLLDSLTLEYHGQDKMNMSVLMPELKNWESKTDGSERTKSLEQFYKAARDKHEGTAEQFSDELIVLVNTLVTLPYGKSEYRDDFRDLLEKASKEAALEADPEKAAALFAKVVSEGVDKLHAEDKYGEPKFAKPSEPVWKPGLENFKVTSGGVEFDAKKIAQAYDDYNFIHSEPDLRARGITDAVDYQRYIAFKDDSGQQYVAAIDKHSMVFSIEKIDVAKLKDIATKYAEENPYEDFKKSHSELSSEAVDKAYLDGLEDKMRAADAGFAFLRPEDAPPNGAANIYDLLGDLEKYENTYALNEFSDEVADGASKIKDENKVRMDDEANAKKTAAGAQKSTPSSSPVRGEASPQTQAFNASAQHMTQDESRQIQRYAASVAGGAFLLRDSGMRQLLEKFSGQELPIGSSQGKFRVANIDMPEGDTAGPLIAYYDKATSGIKVIEVPDYLRRADARETLREMASGPDTGGFMQSVKDAYPELFNLVENHRHSEGVQDEAVYDHLKLDEYWGFKDVLRGMLDQLDDQLAGSSARSADLGATPG